MSSRGSLRSGFLDLTGSLIALSEPFGTRFRLRGERVEVILGRG